MDSIVFGKKERSRIKANRIALIGYRASGKTTIGKKLAEVLGWSFVDMDSKIYEEAHQTIQEMVLEKGWAHFRELESRLLRRLEDQSDQVIATGGGIILKKENRTILRNYFWVVWLKAPVSVIKKRLDEDAWNIKQRPSLTGNGVIEEVERVLAEREEFYRKTSHFSIDGSDLLPDEIIRKIISAWERM